MPGGLFVTRPSPVSCDKQTGCAGIFLQSDPHFGSSAVDYEHLLWERDEAIRRGDRFCVNGDVFDAIIASDQKRFEPSVLHPRIRGRNDIVNAVIEWAFEYYSPAAHLIDMIGVGNHDTKLEKVGSFDPVAVLVERLNRLKGARISYGGYAGFLDYCIHRECLDRTITHPLTIFYWHGSGGGASPASSAAEFAQKGFVEGADVLWFGHKHSRMAYEIERISCPPHGTRPRTRRQWNVRTGSYFRTYAGQTQEEFKSSGRLSNYAADALLPPQGVGGARVVLAFDRKTAKKTLRVEMHSRL